MLESGLVSGHMVRHWIHSVREGQIDRWTIASRCVKYVGTGNGTGTYGSWSAITNVETYASSVLPPQLLDQTSILIALIRTCEMFTLVSVIPWSNQRLFCGFVQSRHIKFENMTNFRRMTVPQFYIHSLKEYINPLCVTLAPIVDKPFLWPNPKTEFHLDVFKAAQIQPNWPNMARPSRGLILRWYTIAETWAC